MAFRGSMGEQSEIAMGTLEALGEVVNENEKNKERAPQKPPGISRAFTSEIQRTVNFKSWREYWDSLPIVSKLFMFMTFIDVCMVLGYAIWQTCEMFESDQSHDEDCAKKKEHLHVVLGMTITAIFLVIFVLEAISQENDFELLACLLLTTVIASRVIYFMVHACYADWARAMGIVIVSLAAIVTIVLGCLTYFRFGWRIYSRLACDLRVKHAAERTIIYFAQNRFATLVKLDFQFLVLTGIMGIAMAVQDTDLSIKNSYATRVMCIFTALGFALGLPWLLAAYYAVHTEAQKLARFLGLASIFTLIFPIVALVAIYRDPDRKERDATESLTISTSLLTLFRLSVWYFMAKLMTLSEAKHDKSEKSDFPLKFRMSNKNPDLLPLLKGAWLNKQFGASTFRRRFFQLSQDYTTLRWAWNSYVLLYYVDMMETDDTTKTIMLHFSVDPDLVVRFESHGEYETWKVGFQVLLALLMAPDNELERQSRIHVGDKRQRKRLDMKEPTHGFTMEAFLNRLGVTTKRNHALGSAHAHPLREAEKELKMKLGSKHSGATPGQGLADKAGKDFGGEDSSSRQSTRIPSGKDNMTAGLDNQHSLDSQGDASPRYSSLTGQSSDPTSLLDSSQGIMAGTALLVETIEYTDLEFGKFLGSGAEGAVWAAWYLDTPVAVKQTNSVHELEMTLCAGQHDNVVGLRGLAKEGSSTYIVLEYCPRGTLDVLLHHTMTSRWDPTKVIQMIRCIARGILHLHSRKPAILHRDIKPANIFVSHGLVLKIGDFGMSRQLKPPPEGQQSQSRPRLRRTLTPGVIGTASYAAPELLDERLQSLDFNVERMLKADVYSFGVTMWEIVQRERPFEGMQFYEVVAGWSDPQSMELEPLTIPKDVSPSAQHMIRSIQSLTTDCTRIDPDSRPTMKTVANKLKQLDQEMRQMAGESALPV